MGEGPDCLLLSGTVVGENPDHVCWDGIFAIFFLCYQGPFHSGRINMHDGGQHEVWEWVFRFHG